MKRITVNLAPVDIRKGGPSYDLSIAVAIQASSGQISDLPESAMFLGELSLDGGLRHTSGILPMVSVAVKHGLGIVFVATSDALEASLVDGVGALPADSLSEMVSYLRGEAVLHAPSVSESDGVGSEEAPDGLDLSHVKGQEHAKRALEVADAGGHNLLMSGPPGAGKTRLARAMPSSLPRMTS